MKQRLGFAIVLLLTGCDLPPLPATKVVAMKPGNYHDVAYYDSNPILRAQAIAWCNDNPGLQSSNPSCDSAYTSKRLQWRREFYGQQTTTDLTIH